MKSNIDNEISSLKNLDYKFFEKLFASKYEKLCKYGLNFNSDRNEVEDIVQDAFISLWANRNKIVISTSLNSYLHRIVYNKLMDNYRKKKKRNERLIAYYYSAVHKAEELNENNNDEKLDKLDNCIDALPKRCKNIFIEKKIKGRKTKDISSTMDVAVKTIEGHITRAYKYLKKCMDELLVSN